MLTESQKSEIANFLLSKKLPIDIMLEVQDHFISQINALELEENLNFEEAFEKVKLSWRKELTLSWKGEMSLMDSTDFMRKMKKQILKSNVLESLKILIPYVFSIFLIANFANVAFFQIYFIAAVLTLLLYALVNYIQHFKDFRLPKKHESHILTLHQDGIFMFFLVISPMINVFSKIFSKPKQFQEMLLLKFEGIENLPILPMFLSLLLFFGGIAYSIISQKNYLKQINRVKIFLEHHQF
jgi:hypothetical protein